MNLRIIPAIMPQHFDDIEVDVSMVKRHSSFVQLDLMDGKFAPEKTWPFHYGTDYNLTALTKEEISFPFWEDMNYELDLMVARPEENIDTWLGIGAARVIFHYAAIYDWKKIQNIDTGIRNFVQLGIAVTIHDDLDQVCKRLDEGLFDFVQVMGISHIGYMGEPFEPQCLDIIDSLKSKYPDITITVDGGVSRETIAALSEAGVSRFVSGSGVFGGGLVEENIQELDQLVVEI
jgi:ribulose-phosphate 3-epimerase